MSQNDQVLVEQTEYTRTDFTALRAHVQGIPVEKIAQVYYAEDAPQLAEGLDRFLTRMRHELVERSIIAKPALAESLKHFRDSRGTVKLLGLLVEISNAAPAKPQPQHLIAQWIRPRLARALLSQHIKTLDDLRQLIEARGHRWWRPIPRLGALKARAVIHFLQENENTLGAISPDALETPPAVVGQVMLSPSSSAVPPLERLSLPAAYDGANGLNRVPRLCFIGARNDLEAINTYLDLFRGKPATFRAYRKELERFLVWCIKYAAKPFSSVMVEDCLGYMRFLEDPDPAFRGKRTPRTSPRWRPFGLESLSMASQAYAVQVITGAFAWLVEMRYLAGNPWRGVRAPDPATKVASIQIGKALPDGLWDKLMVCLDALLDPDIPSPTGQRGRDLGPQYRIARAAMLLMGDSGLRRAEAAGALRPNLRRSDHAESMWELLVLGKRNKWRAVPVSPRTIEAIKAHWVDRGLAFDSCTLPYPLMAPIAIPSTPAAVARYAAHAVGGLPYSPNALARVVLSVLDRIKDDPIFTDGEKKRLEETTAHSLRHTFGTQSVAKNMPIDVAQKIMGHASPDTTAIYVQAEKKRMMEEAEKVYGSRK